LLQGRTESGSRIHMSHEGLQKARRTPAEKKSVRAQGFIAVGKKLDDVGAGEVKGQGDTHQGALKSTWLRGGNRGGRGIFSTGNQKNWGAARETGKKSGGFFARSTGNVDIRNASGSSQRSGKEKNDGPRGCWVELRGHVTLERSKTTSVSARGKKRKRGGKHKSCSNSRQNHRRLNRKI